MRNFVFFLVVWSALVSCDALKSPQRAHDAIQSELHVESLVQAHSHNGVLTVYVKLQSEPSMDRAEARAKVEEIVRKAVPDVDRIEVSTAF